MSRALLTVFVLLILTNCVSAQTEFDLKRYFEGKHVTLRIDMPATKDGVNIYPERQQPMDYSEYANRIRRYGTSIHRGDEIMITKIRVKDKHIEFQLGGGGYGTAGDETDPSVYVPTTNKSGRERRLEDELKKETDPESKKKIKRELEGVRERREREDERNRQIAAQQAESRKVRIEQKALQSGSRFNVHFSRIESVLLTPESLIDALRKYIDFSSAADAANPTPRVTSQYPSGFVRPGVLYVGSPTTYLKEGLKTREVVHLLGEPTSISERTQDASLVTIYEFQRGQGRVVIAEFVDGALVRSRTETRTARSVTPGSNPTTVLQ